MGEYLETKNVPEALERVPWEVCAMGNTLPLTSACNVNCIFCSHRNNPPGVQVHRISPRPLGDIEVSLRTLDPARPIIIGESGTRIIEGEPLTHPAVVEILQMIRSRFPRTPVQITTNGSLLDQEKVKVLKKLGNVVVYLSLNSASVRGRSLLMADSRGLQAIRSAVLLQKHGLPFHGSVVALPHLVGWGDLAETIKYLSARGAETIRVFLPGFSSLAVPEIKSGPSCWKKIKEFVTGLRGEISTPLTCEPPLLEGLEPEVAGVIAASPADLAGIRAGDIIEAVNGFRVHTRVQAFRQITGAGPARLDLRRNGAALPVVVEKEPGQKSGLVLDYDLDPALIDDLGRALRRNRVGGALALTSELAGPLLELALGRFWKGKRELELVSVKNLFFAGNICVAGLLTVTDFSAAIASFLEKRTGPKPPLILLPGIAFDSRGRDLTGRSYLELEERFGLPCEVL